MKDHEFPLQAAIRVERDRPVDDILEAVARVLQKEGVIVAGFLQRESAGDGEFCNRIDLEDIASGEHHIISQALGSGARGCRLDPQALAGVAGPLLAGLDRRPDLLILNRFGKMEVEPGRAPERAQAAAGRVQRAGADGNARAQRLAVDA